MHTYSSFWQQNPRRNLWQHPLWDEFQKSIGRKTWLLKSGNASALVIKHDLPFGLSWLEVPRGPLFEDEEGLSVILDELKDLGNEEKAVFIRLSPYAPLRKRDWPIALSEAWDDHHPQTSLIIDLTQSESDILKQMKPKGRYNIKVAQKHGVTIRQGKDASEFYKLLMKTGNRDGFGIHPQSYYQNMLDKLGLSALLLMAEYESKVIAGGIFVFLDEWGIYYYGASDDRYRNVMAPYLIQWEAIRAAKERGCRYYDFLGIAPEHAKKHPWKGVTEFKKKFGGRIITYPHAKEMVIRTFWYWIYRIYKKVRH